MYQKDKVLLDVTIGQIIELFAGHNDLLLELIHYMPNTQHERLHRAVCEYQEQSYFAMKNKREIKKKEAALKKEEKRKEVENEVRNLQRGLGVFEGEL